MKILAQKLILHIGIPKTGTTSIQLFLEENRKQLREQKFMVPASLAGGNRGNHRDLPFCVLPADQMLASGYAAQLQLTSRVQVRQWRRQCLERFAAEVRGHADPEHTWILSSEYCWVELGTERGIRALKRMLSHLFEHFRVIVYIRNSLETEISRLSQHQKAGRDVRSISTEANPALDYAAGIQRWLHGFRPDELIVRRFQPTSLVGGDILDDFCHVCGIQSDPLQKPARQNRALSLTAMRYLWHLNQELPATRRAGVADLLMRHFHDGTGVQPTLAQWMRHQALYAASNRWVKEYCFPDDDQLWEERRMAFLDSPIDLADPAWIDAQLLGMLMALCRQGKLAEADALLAAEVSPSARPPAA